MTRILIAEDEDRIVSFLEKGLQANGYTTIAVQTGTDAIALARDDSFDLLILDLGLPGADGHEVLREVRGRGERLPIIVLTAFGLFAASMLLAPGRGLIVSAFEHRKFQKGIHMRQGLVSLAQGHPIYEPFTIRLLEREGLARADGVPTDYGRARASRVLRDEKRWEIARADPAFEMAAARYDGLTQIEDVLTDDQIREIDIRIGGPSAVPA